MNHLHEDNVSNFDLYSVQFIDGVESESTCSSNFSSHDESFHEDEMGNEFKLYTNTLYVEDLDDDQPISCHNVYKGALNVVKKSFFEQMDGLELVEDDLQDDTLSYCCERSYFSSSEFDSENDDYVASHDMNNKVFHEVFNENHHAPCNEFYDDLSNVKTNLFADCEKPFEHYGLVSDSDIVGMCEYKLECSLEYTLAMYKDTNFQGMCDPFPYVEYDAFIFETGSMHDSFFR